MGVREELLSYLEAINVPVSTQPTWWMLSIPVWLVGKDPHPAYANSITFEQVNPRLRENICRWFNTNGWTQLDNEDVCTFTKELNGAKYVHIYFAFTE